MTYDDLGFFATVIIIAATGLAIALSAVIPALH